MDYKKLAINALLAGFWVGFAILTASSQPFTKAAVFAALAAAARAAIGFVAGSFNKPVPVDA